MSPPDFRECVRTLYGKGCYAGAGLTPEEDEWITTYLNGGDFGPSLDGRLKALELSLQTLGTIKRDKDRTVEAVEIFHRLQVIRREIISTPELKAEFGPRLSVAAAVLKRDGFRVDDETGELL